MSKTLTPEKLVLFVYDEISDPQECEEISKLVKADNGSYALCNELTEIREKIEQSFASPSEESIRSILNYSRALSVVHMKDHRTMGLVLN
jgi:hypothetical protein